MTLTRIQKETQVKELTELLADSANLVVVENQGLDVAQANEFRGKVRESNGHYRIGKNTLVKLALKGTDSEPLGAELSGPVGIVMNDSDAVSLAKVVVDFIKDNPELVVRAGIMDGKMMTAQEVETLSSMPSLDELRSKIVGLLQATQSKMLRLFAEPGRGVAVCLTERGKQDS